GSGGGVAPALLAHLAQPSARGGGSDGGADGHLGVGLFVVQSHARAMGGRCEVQSTLGAGTTFRIVLPSSAPRSALSVAEKVENVGERSEIIQGSKVAMES